jgi:hypothetical protein
MENVTLAERDFLTLRTHLPAGSIGLIVMKAMVQGQEGLAIQLAGTKSRG